MFGLSEQQSNHNILDQLPKFWYCVNIVGISTGALTKYKHKEVFDE